MNQRSRCVAVLWLLCPVSIYASSRASAPQSKVKVPVSRSMSREDAMFRLPRREVKDHNAEEVTPSSLESVSRDSLKDSYQSKRNVIQALLLTGSIAGAQGLKAAESAIVAGNSASKAGASKERRKGGEDDVPKLLPKVAAQEKCLGGWKYNWRNTREGAICIEPDGCVWRKFDPGITQTAAYEKVSQLYSGAFTAYLARFLIHYEEDRGTGYWRYRQSVVDDPSLLPEQVDEMMQHTLSEYAVSLQYGLSRYTDEGGPTRLLRRLINVYGRNNPDARRQIFIMFSLLEDNQPSEALAQFLIQETRDEQKRLLSLRKLSSLDANNEASQSVRDSLSSSSAKDDYTFKASLGDSISSIINEKEKNNVRKTEFLTTSNLPMLLHGDTPLDIDEEGRFYVPRSDVPISHRFLLEEPERKATSPLSRERSLNWSIYSMFALAGLIGCSATHSMLVPLDVVKTRLQTNPKLYPNLLEGALRIYKEEGIQALTLGGGPTFLGYAWYGLIVYPGYEFLKRALISLVGEISAERLHVPLVVLAGALATAVACIGVCPAEAARIRIVAKPDYATNFVGTVQRIAQEEGIKSLFEGFGPLAIRQVLFGMMKFFIFDSFAEEVYRLQPSLAEQVSTQLFVSFLAGLVAGTVASVVSQPADTILSKMKQEEGISAQQAIKNLVKRFGPAGLFIGLPSRVLWAAPIIAGQFLLYDLFKNTLQVAGEDLTLFFDVLSTPSDFIIM
mmetsp:Transcript_14940/g.22611  ORF Transcript_14940/g.22611 Transcript_14940/m.22611 type:complete len:731 (-) Transcript_14940:138-2330(-)